MNTCHFARRSGSGQPRRHPERTLAWRWVIVRKVIAPVDVVDDGVAFADVDDVVVVVVGSRRRKGLLCTAGMVLPRV